MIGFLRGTLEYKAPQLAIIDTGGVGYQVSVPVSTYDKLPQIGEEVKIYTYLNVRENALELYGFASLEEKELFNLLISVSDVGPRTAINILSGIGVETFKLAIANKDLSALTTISGIGKKTAERLIVELKDKIGEIKFAASDVGMPADGNVEDAMAALVSLGYSRNAVREAMRKVYTEFTKSKEASTVQELIKQTLKLL